MHAGSGGVGSRGDPARKASGRDRLSRPRARPRSARLRRRAGADEVRGYDEIDDLRVDVVLDPVGGEVFTRSLPLLNPLGTIVAIGFAGGLWQDPSVQWLVGRNASVVRLLPRPPDAAAARRSCASARDELLALWADEADRPARRRDVPARRRAATRTR